MSAPKSTPCPICKKPASPEYRPFCSKRCADVDLARWLREDYVIEGPSAEAEDNSLPSLDPDDQ